MNKIIFLTACLIGNLVFADETCDYQALSNERASMRASAYWRGKQAEFLDLIEKEYPRGCDFSNEIASGLEIFADDLEMVGPDDNQTRILPRTMTVVPSYKVSSSDLSFDSLDTSLFQSNVSEVRMYTKVGYGIIYVRTCSPKVALASLLAYAPYALSAGCGSTAQSGPSVEKWINDEVDKILKGETN